MAKYTTMSMTHKTRGRLELAKEELYGEDLADEVCQDKFLNDLAKMTIDDNE